MKKLSPDTLKRQLEGTINSHISSGEKTAILALNGVSMEPDEPPLWHRYGNSAWAIFLDENNSLHVLTTAVTEVEPRLLG